MTDNWTNESINNNKSYPLGITRTNTFVKNDSYYGAASSAMMSKSTVLKDYDRAKTPERVASKSPQRI